MSKRSYSSMSGFFLQDDPESKRDPAALTAILPRFGLKDDSDDRWTKFRSEIKRLNESAQSGTEYKVIFLARHGHGYHNVAMAKYTREGWKSKWTKLYGDGEFVWGPDPELTELGVEQAQDVNRAWRAELEHNIPLPEKLYTSPLRRAIKTDQVSFEGLLRPDLKTTVVEIIRAKYGVSTFNKRRSRSEIERDFPECLFGQGFTENDEYWRPDIRETHEELDSRVQKALDMMFDDDAQFISITSHNVFIEAFLRVCNHRPWKLPTGGVIPVVLKAED